MTCFPTLPPNSSHQGPQPPQGEPFVGIVADIHRRAGRIAPLDIAFMCAVEAGQQIMAQRRSVRPDRCEMIRWLLHHAGQWTELEIESRSRVLTEAAE